MLGICGVGCGEVQARVIGPWNDPTLSFGFGTMRGDIFAGPGKNIPEAWKDAVRAAFQTWTAAHEAVSFTEADTDLDILVEWRPTNDPDIPGGMRGGTIAHADFPPGYSIITQTLPLPLHFDNGGEHKWVVRARPGAFDIETVALHEVGHLLGLAHSAVRGSVLFPTVRQNFLLRELQWDDYVALGRLYG